MNNKELIAYEIKETIKDKVFETFLNQAKRIIDLKGIYYKWDKLHCEIHNNMYLDNDVKQLFLKNLDRKNPIKDLLITEQKLIRWDNPDRIKAIYNKKAEKFLDDVSDYVNKRINEDVTEIEKLEFSFNRGCWKINNDKFFRFKTILAGGYNVQCLHIRVIYYYGRKATWEKEG